MRSKKAVSLGSLRPVRGRPGLDDATPERLTHARRAGTAELDRQGVRRIGDPFDALLARGLLDRRSPDENARLWQAGDRLRRHWHMTRLDGLTAFDFTRESVDTSPVPDGTPSEAALRHRDAIRAAMTAVGPRLWPYLSGIAIDARPMAELRGLVTDTGHARTADALVLERLREALHRLCDLWQPKRAERPRRIGAWRDTDAVCREP